MSIAKFYEKDIDASIIKKMNVFVIGYGSQGHAHALNLKESGVNVTVGLRSDSSSKAKAEEQGLTVKAVAEGTQNADLIMILLPDELQAEVYKNEIEPNLKSGTTVAFAHGFNVHFGFIKPKEDCDFIMIAPKGPGHTVRYQYTIGSGVPTLIAVASDVSGNAKQVALSYAAAIGGARVGVLETDFKQETETDLFGEQSVLCGGSMALVQAGFEVLVEAGYEPEMAYFECLHELKLIVDLMYEGGIENMRYSISNTAEYGDITRGPRIVTEETKNEMHKILQEIQSGKFAREWMAESKRGMPNLLKKRQEISQHPVEKVGTELRKMMPWYKGKKLVNK